MIINDFKHECTGLGFNFKGDERKLLSLNGKQGSITL